MENVDLRSLWGRVREQGRSLTDRARRSAGERWPGLLDGPLEGDPLPEGGPLILASNCRSRFDARALEGHADGALVRVAVPAQVQFQDAPWADHQQRPEVAHAREALEAGAVVVCFPEGGPSPDGHVHRGRVGFGALVLECAVPVVPVGISADGTVRVGDPLDFTRFEGLTVDRSLARGLTDTVVQAIVDLAELPYSDTSVERARQLRRSESSADRQRRRERADAERRAERQALDARREEGRRERADLAARAARAEQLARQHAEQAAERERRRGADVG